MQLSNLNSLKKCIGYDDILDIAYVRFMSFVLGVVIGVWCCTSVYASHQSRI
jgi:hypothetical protein